MEESKVQKNELGGVYIDEDEIREAFEFFDVHKKGVLTPQDLKVRLAAFYKNMPLRELKFLISEPDFNVKTLTKLLKNNELTGFDPVKEAFRVYDPNDTGFIDPEMLRQIFQNLGYGEITKEDLDVLISTADVDGDGKISLEDFRDMLKFNKNREAEEKKNRKRIESSVGKEKEAASS